MNTQEQPGLKIAQIILEKAEFSHRDDFLDHPASTEVPLNIVFSFESGLTADKKRALVRVTAQSETREELYALEFRMVALLEVEEHAPNFPLEEYVKLNAWVMLFPFLRETVANVTGRGRFGPVLLKPVNIQAATQAPEAAQTAAASNSRKTAGR